MNKKITQLSASLLIALPIISFAQSHGGGMGGPPAGVGGGVSGSIGGATNGMGHASGIGGGAAGSVSGSAGGHASDMSSLSDTGMSKAKAHRLEMQARKDAAAAKAAEAQARGAENANANAAFGQSTAASARTLKDADVATRTAFHDSVTSGAKLQGKGDKSGSADDSDSDDNEALEFGQDTAAQAKTLKAADAETRQAFGGTVSTGAKLKSADKKPAKPSRAP